MGNFKCKCGCDFTKGYNLYALDEKENLLKIYFDDEGEIYLENEDGEEEYIEITNYYRCAKCNEGIEEYIESAFDNGMLRCPYCKNDMNDGFSVTYILTQKTTITIETLANEGAEYQDADEETAKYICTKCKKNIEDYLEEKGII